MDNRNRVIEFKRLFFGTIDGASVYPRDVVREALNQNAAAVIFAHNHPSGVAEPSQADENITKRLKDALALIDVRVLNHIVVGEMNASLLQREGLSNSFVIPEKSNGSYCFTVQVAAQWYNRTA